LIAPSADYADYGFQLWEVVGFAG